VARIAYVLTIASGIVMTVVIRLTQLEFRKRFDPEETGPAE